MSALLFQLMMTITQCVWTSVTEIGAMSAAQFQLVVITQCVWTSVTEIGMDVCIAFSTGDDNTTMCVD